MNKTIFALGFFDGVHLGHQALLKQCRLLAEQNHCACGAITFSSHPDALVHGYAPVLINTPQDREKLLRRYVDTVITLPFDWKMLRTPWNDFLDNMWREYNAAGFVCGDDFRFGARGEGTPEKLMEYCAVNQLVSAVIPEQTCSGTRVSSTYIRELIEAGNVSRAAQFLGHPQTMTATVVHGHKLGRTIGVPTANIMFPVSLAIPRFGVYATRVHADGKVYSGVTNVGVRPTVHGKGVNAETWLLDFSGDLYGKEITLEFHCYLRPESRFTSLDALREEINRNAEQTREYFAGMESTDWL